MSVLMLGSHMSIAGGVSQALCEAESVKSNAVQVFTKNNRQWNGPPIDWKDIERWNEFLPAKSIVYAVSHASYLINLASPQDDLWQKSIAAHSDEIVRANAYGITHVVLHPGAHTGSGEAVGIARISEALNRIHEATPACCNTITCLELMAGQGTTLGSSFTQLRQIINGVADQRRVGVCLDTCHAFAAGYDFRTPAAYEAMMTQLDQELGREWVKVWHLNDSKGKLASHLDRHTHIGEGEIGLEGFRNILNDERWCGIAMLLETPKEADLNDDRRNLAALCSLVQQVDRIPAGLVGQ